MADLASYRLTDIESLLRERIGLNPHAVHRGHVEDAIRERMTACGISESSSYLSLLETRPDEWQELIERLVVVESWFFRDVQPFRFLEKYLSSRNHDRPLRLLSVPCGSGEEPYSMAITLLNMGIDPGQFRIDGVDISQQALRQAMEGAYGESSFREHEEPVADFRKRYFHENGTRRIVSDAVKTAVRFHHGNLVETGFLGGEQQYDAILCRNLLIYLDANARRLALANLQRLLVPDGVLYVGHAEGGIMRGMQFDGCDPAYPFAFRVRTMIDLAPSAKTSAILTQTPIDQPFCAKQEPTISIPILAEPRFNLTSAREAANAGHLAEAAEQCYELLTNDRPTPDIYCLLGVIHQAQGNFGEAERLFQKALYLEPRHHESLVHLALLATRRGEELAASNYRRRAGMAEVEQ